VPADPGVAELSVVGRDVAHLHQDLARLRLGHAELAGRNIALFAAHERACAEDKYADPTYLRWHAHVSRLIAEARPGRDADFLAHTILGSFDGELVRHLGVERLKRSVRELAVDLTS
jgi:hypothetical protein